MALLNLQGVDLSVGGPQPLLERVELGIEAGERVCIVGRNGAGKSTLLRLLAGEIEPDDGSVRVQQGVRISKLTQEVPAGTAGSVFAVVAHAVGDVGDHLAEFHRLSQNAATPEDIEALGRAQARIDAENGWDLERQVSEVISRLQLDPDADFASLSGGMKRRVLLAQALARNPDLLLLDEPTNHLDIANIDWLEGFLKDFPGSVVFVTHDRSLLRAVATRIVEIDRGQVTSWPGDYDNYLRRREERLNAEAQEQARFDKRLAQEEAWIRQGIKARRKRNMGRVRELQEMRRERAQRRQQTGRVRMEAAEASSSGKRVIEAEDLRFAYDGQTIVRDFSTTVLRSDRIGIVGPNGSGKTTLIRLLLGQLAPQQGHVKTGTNLQVAYFDQQRAQLDETATAIENVAGGRESIEVGGTRKHAMSYMQDFLFSPARARAPITRLSGGERNRLLLARLFSQPSNMLVMDEPTNDLDIETLELLEELIADYRGTLLLVSHDRAFLDNVITSILVLEGGGRVDEHIGGYSDYLAERSAPGHGAEGKDQRAQDKRGKDKRSKDKRGRDWGGDKRTKNESKSDGRQSPPRSRLSSWERQELEQLPARIDALERQVNELTERLGDPALYQEDAGAVTAVNAELGSAQAELDRSYQRWEELDGRASGG